VLLDEPEQLELQHEVQMKLLELLELLRLQQKIS
jgi:hypothetical protein